MRRMLKVFVSGPEQAALAKRHQTVMRYDGFALVSASPAEVKALAKAFPVEDITEEYRISLPTRTIDTRRPRVEPGGRVRGHPSYKGLGAPPVGKHHYLVQFVGPVKSQWVRGVRQAGGEPREPYAGFAYVVRADRKQIGAIAKLPFVRWVGHLPHPDRVEPSVMRSVSEKRDGATLPRTRVLKGVFNVELFGKEDVAKAAAAVKKLGFDVLVKNPDAKLLVVRSKRDKVTARQIAALSAVHAVRHIRPRSLDRPSNDVAAGLMGTARALRNPGLGLSGKGELIGVCDTGLDTGDSATVHPDFAKRVVAIKSYPLTADLDPYVTNPAGNDGAADVDSGHGTHVAGSILGSGASSAGLPGLAGPVRGLAYRAKLYFQAVEQRTDWKKPADLEEYGRYGLWGLPSSLGSLFGDAYKRGVRIHSNSWGGGDPGVYDEQSRQLDEFVWQHKDFCVVVANGNDGTDKDGDGAINGMSISSPATAKNCISVGASENRRPSFNAETYGGWWPKDYPVKPIRNDPMANDPEQVAAFSSRGPTRDGRVKPEVVAPGTFILSTRSRMIAANNTAWAPLPQSKLYFFMGGTSMATPLTAGAVAIVREYLRTKRGVKQPTAALLKAVLVAGARRLNGSGTKAAVFDNDQGFGRVDLDAALSPASPLAMDFEEVDPGLATGQIHSTSVKVKSAGTSLRIVLAYSDYPGNTLLNNLNLIVTSPAGKRYVGNQKGASTTDLDKDNNVEVVQVKSAAAGDWKVDVVGSNVVKEPQDFALVWIGRV